MVKTLALYVIHLRFGIHENQMVWAINGVLLERVVHLRQQTVISYDYTPSKVKGQTVVQCNCLAFRNNQKPCNPPGVKIYGRFHLIITQLNVTFNGHQRSPCAKKES